MDARPTSLTRKVYIPTQGLHDYSLAREYGELVYLADAPIPRGAVTSMIRTFRECVEKSHRDDFILIGGPPMMCVIAAIMFVLQHGKINLLIYLPTKDVYVVRNIVFEERRG